MTAKFIVSGLDTTIQFSYTQPTAKMQSVITAAAHYLWNAGFGNHGTEEAPIPFESLTNIEKLALVDKHLKQVIMDLAKTYSATSAVDTARTAALLSAETNLNL